MWRRIPNPYYPCGYNSRPSFFDYCPTDLQWGNIVTFLHNVYGNGKHVIDIKTFN